MSCYRVHPIYRSPRSGLSRRDFLTVGAVAGLGLNLGDFFAIRRAQAEQKHYDFLEPTAESVIQIFLPGGMSAQETFDPKPYAPIEYRGEMGSIPTNVEGIVLGDTLKQTAQITDKLTILRAMTHGEAAHERGTHNMFTGYRPSPALVFPSMGSIVSHEYGPRNNLPPYVCIPNQPNPYAGTGYLSSSFAPFSLGADPASSGFKVRDLSRAADVDDARFARRRSALEAVNDYFTKKTKADAVGAMDTFYERAFSLIESKDAREAFDIDAEDAKLRDEYGRNPAGQRMLMARRLVEAGVRFVTLTYGSWDHHQRITPSVRAQMPAFDTAFARLIRDLDERGLLDTTLVMVTTEFGRTPKINSDGGRDHWPKVGGALVAGGGLRCGQVLGSTTRWGEEPLSRPVHFRDVFATLYHRLGIDVATTQFTDLAGRPQYLVGDHRPLPELVG